MYDDEYINSFGVLFATGFGRKNCVGSHCASGLLGFHVGDSGKDAGNFRIYSIDRWENSAIFSIPQHADNNIGYSIKKPIMRYANSFFFFVFRNISHFCYGHHLRFRHNDCYCAQLFLPWPDLDSRSSLGSEVSKHLVNNLQCYCIPYYYVTVLKGKGYLLSVGISYIFFLCVNTDRFSCNVRELQTHYVKTMSTWQGCRITSQAVYN